MNNANTNTNNDSLHFKRKNRLSQPIMEQNRRFSYTSQTPSTIQIQQVVKKKLSNDNDDRKRAVVQTPLSLQPVELSQKNFGK